MNLTRLFSRKKEQARRPYDTSGEIQFPQTRRGDGFSGLEWRNLSGQAEYRLYDALRQSVPIIDAAIGKIVRLVGGFSVECDDSVAQSGLEYFLKNVPVNASQQGISAFMDGFFDQLLTYGTAIGEVVPDSVGVPWGLFLPSPEVVSLRQGENPMIARVYVRSDSGKYVPVSNQNWLVYSALNPMPGCCNGRSLLRGLPFVSNILVKIFHTIEQNWERAGNVRFAVTYHPNGETDAMFAKERAMQIAQSWSEAMQEQNDGHVSDFVAVGDVKIQVIGADGQILDSQVPVREMLEQIVAKLGVPPFLLGLSWSSTERMSEQQADILTSELEAYRRLIEPVLCKICRMWLLSNGFSPDHKIHWDNINLQDEVELANAAYLRAKTEALQKECEKTAV